MAMNVKPFPSLTCKLNLPHFSNFLFFALGLSIGFTIGFYDLHTFTFIPSPPSSIQATPPSSPPPPPPPTTPPTPPPIQPPSSDHDIVARKANNITGFSLEDHTRMKSLRHNLSDEELLRKASMMGLDENLPKSFVAKVAFMFLTKGPLPMAPLWELFFKGYRGFYSIYVHAHPSYNDPFPHDSVFHGRFIPSQEITWGSISMIDAERRLLANALLDTSNQRFVLISEACIPIFNFTTVYNYLINSNRSFLGSFDSPRTDARGRYNKQMWPNINITDWRKGSQWFEAHRDSAIQIVSDAKYYAIFREYCRPPCYNDEHYLPTLANIMFPSLISNRSVTYVDWSKGGPHPAKFERKDISREFIDRVRFGSSCSYNGNETRTCFLFVRKLMPSALEHLLQIASTVLGF